MQQQHACQDVMQGQYITYLLGNRKTDSAHSGRFRLSPVNNRESPGWASPNLQERSCVVFVMNAFHASVAQGEIPFAYNLKASMAASVEYF